MYYNLKFDKVSINKLYWNCGELSLKKLMDCKVHRAFKCLLNAYSVALQSICHILKCLNVIALDNKRSKMHLQTNANAFLRTNFTFLAEKFCYCSDIWATGAKVIFWICSMQNLYQITKCLNIQYSWNRIPGCDLLYLLRFWSMEPVDTFLFHEATKAEELSGSRS